MHPKTGKAGTAFLSLLLFILGSMFPLPVSAHMVGLSTEDLTRGSETVVEGDVEEVRSRWSGDGKLIYTSATVAVRRVIRGVSVPQRVVVEYEGGEVGETGLAVSDVAAMTKGEQVILFLKKGKSHGDGEAYHTVGKAQGKYTVGKDGIARKRGFSIGIGKEAVDNDLPVDLLIEKIKRVK